MPLGDELKGLNVCPECYLSFLAVVRVVHEVEGPVGRIIRQRSDLIGVLPLHTQIQINNFIQTLNELTVRRTSREPLLKRSNTVVLRSNTTVSLLCR